MNINFTIQVSPAVQGLFNKLITIGELIVATNEETVTELQAVKASVDTLSTAVDALVAKAQQADVTDPTVVAAISDVKSGLQAVTDKVNTALTPVTQPA